MHEVLVNCLGGLSLPRQRVVRLTDRPDMTVDVYCGCKTTNQQQQINNKASGVLHLMNGMDVFYLEPKAEPGRVAQSVGHLTCKSGVLGSIPGLATYFRFSFRFLKKGSCQLPAKVCARSTG